MSIDDLLKFFQEKMNNPEDCKQMTLEGFSCFKNMFLVINEKLKRIQKNTSSSGMYSHSSGYGYDYENKKEKEGEFGYRVNVLPEHLEGIKSIWNFILVAEDEKVADQAIDFLNKLYLHVAADLEDKIIYMRTEYLQTCFSHLRDVLDENKSMESAPFVARCLRCLSLIRSLMDESEKRGVGNLKSHSALVKGELLTFHIINEVTSGSDVPKKAEFRMHANSTVFELRHEIGKAFKATWDQIKLTRSMAPKDVKDNENGKTLGDIRIRNGENITANKRPTPPIPQAPLVYSDGTVNPLAKKIFLEWFDTFSEDGRMSPQTCADFIHSCTNDYCKAEDKRVKEVFSTYDNDKDGFLTVDNFLEFYMSAARHRPHVVWNNLNAHHYRNDLKKASEVEEEKIDIHQLARYIISQDDQYFSIIFSLLDMGGKIATEAWKLLNRLPTSKQIYQDIVQLKGIRDENEKNWNLILNTESTYKLLYSLHAIEYLMEDDGDDEEDEESNFLSLQDPKMLEYKKNWRADFIVYGGFDHLFKIFNKYANKDHKNLTIFEKNIMSFVLKILKNYLAATFASTVPGLYRNLSFIRLFHLSLDFIGDYIKSEAMLL